MARRRSRKIAKKLQPTELCIDILFDGNPISGYIDLAQILSQLNRKTFRQGMQYVVAGIELISTGTANVMVNRLPHYWPAVNAWTKAQALWKQQQDNRLEESGLEQTVARHRDFKIFMNGAHATAGTSNNIQSRDVIDLVAAQVVSPTVAYDWEASEIVWPNYGAPGTTVERALHMMGDNNGTTSVGLIKAYAESRNRPMQVDPNIVDVSHGGAFGSMFDVADDSGDIITNAQEHNNLLPYLNDIDSTEEFYPGGTNSPTTAYFECMLSVSATGDRVLGSRGQGFLANCGLLNIVGTAEAGDVLRITMAPGDYKGVMARPMQDVN